MITIQQNLTLIKSLTCLSAGAITTFAFAPYNQVWLVFVSFSMLLYCWHNETAKKTFWLGWIFGVGLQCGGVGWIYYSMHVHGGGSVLFSSLVILLLAAYLSIYTGLAGYVINRFCKTSSAIKLLVLYPLSFAIFEWMQGFILTGFAWMQVGYTQLELPLSGYAPILGNHAVGALVIMTSGVLVYVIDNKIIKAISLEKTIITIVALWLIGFGLKQIHWTQVDGEELKVSLVQANIAQKQKWVRSNRLPTLNLYRELTLQNLDSDVIVWPETAIPGYKHQFKSYIQSLNDVTRKSQTDLLLGVFIKNFETGRYYNSVIDLDGGDYRKRHLVPLGEFVPLRFMIEYFNQWMNIPMSDIASGDESQNLMEVAGYPVGISICFEDAFARDMRRDLPEARYLVNVSNDAWFEDSREPHQHHAIARMRALESGRYMLRATNTGITSIIGPHGEEISVAPQFETAVLNGKITPLKGSTPYIFWGDWMMLGISIIGIGFVVWRGRKVLVSSA